MATDVFLTHYNGAWGQYYDFKVTAEEGSPSVSGNTSPVTAYAYVRRNDTRYSAYNPDGSAWSITIDGETFSGTSAWDTRDGTRWQLLGTATKTITHNNDGSKTITISGTHTGNKASGPAKMGNASGSGTFTLSTIPRASSVTATSANIEESSVITINRASSSFTHTLTYSFGSLSGTIATKTSNTSVGWTIPSSFYAQIPNAKSGTVTITCTTYNGNTSIGTKTCTLTATASESRCKPTLSATVVDSNNTTIALTGDSTKLVKYKSTALITITTSAKNSASISSKNVNGTTVSGTTYSISDVSADSFTVTSTDSRGYSNSVTLRPTIVNYIPLTLNATIKRPQPTTGEVSLQYSGNYFNGNFGSVNNTLSVSYQYKLTSDSTYTQGTTSISPTITNDTYSLLETILGNTFNYQNAYDFILTVSDRLTTQTFTTSVTKGIPLFNWGDDFFKFNIDAYDKNGIAINGEQKVLWQDDEGSFMKGDQIANLSENVSEQNLGIVLVFSAYYNGHAQNWGWHEYFIPKKMVELMPGYGHSILIPNIDYDYGVMSGKYIYVYNDHLAGNANNVGVHGNVDNSRAVLRYVIGI